MISVKIDGNIALVTVDENIVSENISDFETRIESMKEETYVYYVFDFKGVEYVCSSALGILASVLRTALESSATVYFCSLSDPLRKLFDMTKFLTMVKEASDLDSLLSQLK